MYAIRSYYERRSEQERPPICLLAVKRQDNVRLQPGQLDHALKIKEPAMRARRVLQVGFDALSRRIVKLVKARRVITSYSIHYTKLYEGPLLR